MVEAPRPAVAIVLLRDDGRMLMIRRAEGIPKAGFWSPPTGRVEPGESAAEAARREAREELGLAVTPQVIGGLVIGGAVAGILTWIANRHWR